MRRLPLFAIVTAPLTLEAFRVAAVHPELGLFEVDRLSTGAERALDTMAELFAVVRHGAQVINITAVTYLRPVPNCLGLVFVVHAVEPAVEVVLVGPPRNRSEEHTSELQSRQ